MGSLFMLTANQPTTVLKYFFLGGSDLVQGPPTLVGPLHCMVCRGGCYAAVTIRPLGLTFVSDRHCALYRLVQL